MALFGVSEPSATAPRGFALFALGFRPFFLLAGFAAVIVVPLWAAAFGDWYHVGSGYGGYGWHAHEMIFGYTMAVIAGFLLTAVRNWTGVDTATGASLAALAGLWLAARLLAFAPVPGWLIAGVDLLFLPALGVAVGIPLMRSKQRHNLVFIPLLALLTVANLLVHLAVFAGTETWRLGIDLSVGLIILLITLVGGRVVPFFIERGLPGVEAPKWPKLEAVVFAVTLIWLLTKLLVPASPVLAVTAVAAALIHGVRIAAWYTPRIWSVPLLWVLYLGFTWLVIGFFFDALAGFGVVAPSVALHGFTAGTVGVLTLGMMARVSLGHTGREMRSHWAIDLAFGLLNLAVFIRVMLPLFLPGHYPLWVVWSGIAWLAAFLLFIVIYTPILIRPRVDGRPG